MNMIDCNFNLNEAAYSGNIEKALLAMKHGADIFNNDNQALKTAVRYNQENMVDLLISLGANPNDIVDSIVEDTIGRQCFSLFKKLVNKHGLEIDDVFKKIIVKSVCYGAMNFDFAEFAINHCGMGKIQELTDFLKNEQILGKNKSWLEMLYEKRILELSIENNHQYKKIKI